MSTIPSFTNYDTTPKFWVCTNPQCAEGHPGWTGEETGKKCFLCKQPLVKSNSEPVRRS